MPNQFSKLKAQLDSVLCEIECYLLEGMSVQEISNIFGYGYGSVYNCIIRNGLGFMVSVKNNGKSETFKKNNQYYNDNHILTKDVLYKLYHEDMLDLYEISNLYNMSPSGVLYRMRKYKISTRNKLEASSLMYIKHPEIRDKHRKNANNGITGIFKNGNNYTNTWIEMAFESFCCMNDIKYIKQFQITDGGHRYDFLVGTKLLVEVDGVYWHSLDGQSYKDRINENYAVNRGYIVIRFTDIEIKDSKGGCFERIRDFI